jgi:molybdopterin-guanine dinucleotide biosynthesis protein A
MIKTDKICGAILVGGEGKRLGKDKIYVKLNGKPLFKIMYDKLTEIFSNVYFIGRKINDYPFYLDEFNKKAAISGIYTALKKANTDFCFITAVDLPLLKPELIELLIRNTNPEYDIIVPFVREYFEPLVAVYSKNLLCVIEKNIEQNNLKINSLFKNSKVLKLDENRVKKIDPSFDSFININREEDLERLLKKVEK